jgi:hypothetical protein
MPDFKSLVTSKKELGIKKKADAVPHVTAVIWAHTGCLFL